MFPNFTSLSQRQRKKQALYDSVERDLQNEQAKREAYQGAVWASDVEKNNINLLRSTTTASTQTDANTGSSERVFSSDQQSGTNNEPDIGDEDDSLSDLDDNETQRRRLLSLTADIPVEEDVAMDFDDEEIQQQRSFTAIKAVFERYPEVATWGLHPFRKASSMGPSELIKSVVLGKNAELRNQGNGKRSTFDPDNIDWILTEENVMDRVSFIQGFDFNRERRNREREANINPTDRMKRAFEKLKLATLESKINRAERELMSQEDQDAQYINPNKRRPRGQLDGKYSKYRRLSGESFSGDINEDEATAKQDIFDLYNADKATLDRLVVVPIDKENKPLSKFKVILSRDHSNLIIVKIGSSDARNNPTIEKKTSWVYTSNFLKERITNISSSINPRQYAAQADQSVSSGMATQIDSKDEALDFIIAIYNRLPWIDQLEIRPIQNYRDGPRKSDSYKFSDNMKIVSIKGKKKPTVDVMNSINWALTMNEIVLQLQSYDEMLSDVINDEDINMRLNAPQEYENMKAKQKEIRDAFKSLNINLKNEQTPVDAVAFAGRGFGKVKLKGRGLVGAGRVSEADDIRGFNKPRCIKPQAKRAKNLRDIEGSGSASDMKYHRLGSKYIRVPDLKNNKLKVVYPNRTPLTPLRQISSNLAELINKLVFENDIDQHLYGSLNLEEKKLFTELLKATHLQHHFTNSPTDPIEALKAEFDKLRGQVLLGNNNKDLIRELKSIAVDLYSQKLIGEDEFKSIILI